FFIYRLQECSEFVEFSAPQLTIMGEAATPERQEDVVQVAGHASSTA
ncbi:Os04g0289800, partial [Oryza sativa Japonica Group]